MKAVLQRVKSSRVFVGEREVSRIGAGLNILLGVEKGDTEMDVDVLAEKILGLRIFEDEAGKLNLSIIDRKGSILAVSQFTLCANLKKGRRPSFDEAAGPELAMRLYEYFVKRLKSSGLEVRTGEFAAKMTVEISNNGPVTFVLDSKDFL